MAGGMGRGGGNSLYDRVHCTTAAEPPTVRHVWVTTAAAGRHAGLLLEWRKMASGWQGRVVHTSLEAGAWALVEEWVPAELLEPA